MSTKFYTLLTDIGAAKLANATALGVPLKITQMAVGDGGGILPTPNSVQTSLIAEKRRANLNSLSIDPKNSSQIIAEQVIPESEGGWWIREVGLFDESGTLIAVGNCPETYKPLLAEGSGRTQTVRMVLITSSAENITLKIDPSVVLATRKYVDDKVLELRVYVDEQLAKKMDKVANGADIANVGEFLRNLGIGDNSSRASTGFFPQGAVTLPVNTDLNTQKIPGAYYQQSNSAVVKSLNYPEDGFAGSLLVLKNGANGNDGCVQEYTLYHSGSTYRRVYNVNSKSWTEWDRIVYASELNRLGLDMGSTLPVGVPVPWPLASAPAGWLKCNGAAFSGAQYPQLAKAYPGLRLPDLRGEFIRGWDDGRGVDPGRALLSPQVFAMQDHAHTMPTAQGFADVGLGGSKENDIYSVMSDKMAAIGTVTNDGKWDVPEPKVYMRSDAKPVGNNDSFFPTSTNPYTFLRTYKASSGWNNPKINIPSTASETRPRNFAFSYIVRAI